MASPESSDEPDGDNVPCKGVLICQRGSVILPPIDPPKLPLLVSPYYCITMVFESANEVGEGNYYATTTPYYAHPHSAG